jgi:hypothetical protein
MSMMTRTTHSAEQLSASFRDPSGFLFSRDGILYRQINQIYTEDYARLMTSGLYAKLVKAGLLIPHTETDQAPAETGGAFKVIKPERVPFVSYPYEWSFSQLKDAALVTLKIQKRALRAGMSLKDASAYNIQFAHGRPVLIDTLSFASYQPGRPWEAYRQFCQHFLAPLALMAYVDVRLSRLLRDYIDGLPLDLASRLLPWRTRFEFGLLTHIHAHAKMQARYAGSEVKSAAAAHPISENAMLGLIESLERTVNRLNWTPSGTEWESYYEATNYSDLAFEHKRQLVAQWVMDEAPAMLWDLGANTGVFSRIAGRGAAFIASFDLDPAAVEQNYRAVKADHAENLMPLLLDLRNPSPALGWANSERESFEQRGPADMVLALAVIHHLAISNNVPLPQLASFLAKISRHLVIEFVPKSDSQVRKLLLNRVDIFPEYTVEGFERAFAAHFALREKVSVRESERFLYRMESR